MYEITRINPNPQSWVMGLLSQRLLLRSIRRLYSWSKNDPVDEELRGWNWDRPPLKPRAYLDLGVSEIASKYCETRRDIWLRRVLGVKPEPSDLLLKGKIIHEAVTRAVKVVTNLSSKNYKPWEIYEITRESWRSISTNEVDELRKLAENVYKYTLITLLGELAYENTIHGSSIPLIAVSEYKVDGSYLGLSSNLSIDVLAEGGIIIDFKYGQPRDFHKLSLTGYALALEAEYETPHDYGLLIYVNMSNNLKITVKPVFINSYLRRWFVTERDEIIDILLEKREPPRDTKCNNTCPYFKVCWS